MAISSTSFKPGQSGNPKGRRRLALPTDAHERIKALAAKGCRERDIARMCGMSATTWLKRKAEDQTIVDALDAGRQVMHDNLVGKLYSKAMKGDTTALIFALKAFHSYSDQGTQPGDAKPTVIINLPGAVSLDQYRKDITIETSEANAEPADHE